MQERWLCMWVALAAVPASKEAYRRSDGESSSMYWTTLPPGTYLVLYEKDLDIYHVVQIGTFS